MVVVTNGASVKNVPKFCGIMLVKKGTISEKCNCDKSRKHGKQV